MMSIEGLLYLLFISIIIIAAVLICELYSIHIDLQNSNNTFKEFIKDFKEFFEEIRKG